MEILACGVSEKTKPIKAKQSQFRYTVSSTNQRQDFVTTNQELFRGLGYRKVYTVAYVKSEFYEFWEVNHEKQ